MKHHHILQLFDAPAEVPAVMQERLNARQRLLFSATGKRLKTEDY